MKISKVINNNVLSAFDENGQEVVLMGRGLGFKAKTGDDIDESRVQKVFCIENSALSRQFQEMISNIPMEHMQISADIISYAKNECGMELNQSIYVALTDHINFAIERYRNGIALSNAILWEIRQFYRREYLVGEYALRLFAERLDIHFPEDEAGFIALHFVNAEYNTDIHDTYMITDVIQKGIEIVKAEYQKALDEKSMHYERFVAHLKFFARRIFFSKEMLSDEEQEFSDLIELKYSREYACARKIADYIEAQYDCTVTKEEIMYLAIHIRRITTDSDE